MQKTGVVSMLGMTCGDDAPPCGLPEFGARASLLHAIDRKGAWFLVKLKWTPHLVGAVWASPRWTTVERDAQGEPVSQVAEVDFSREGWAPDWRVFAVRSRERRSGHQTGLWEDLDYTVHFYVTNDHGHTADDLARRYDGRAGIESIIAERFEHPRRLPPCCWPALNSDRPRPRQMPTE